jgi:hypothetical protein
LEYKGKQMRIPRRPKDVPCLDRQIELVTYLPDKLKVYFDNAVGTDDLERFCSSYLVKLQNNLDNNQFESFWAEPVCCLHTQIEGKIILISLSESLVQPGLRIYFYTLHGNMTYGTDFDVSEERDIPIALRQKNRQNTTHLSLH